MSTKNTTTENENTTTTATENENENKAGEITPCEPLAEIRTPAAIAAAARGEKNHVVNVPKRYSQDKSRYLKVDDNPEVIIPTDEDVEVAENEYFELKRSSLLRKATAKMVEKAVRDANNAGKAL